jgi:hypothetical protein
MSNPANYFLERPAVACPFFFPTARVDGGWAHPYRLPLGGGWSGLCQASGQESTTPSPEQLRHYCNLGYALTCERLPAQRAWDSIRFGARAIPRNGAGVAGFIQIRYVCERDHLPADSGWLDYDPVEHRFRQKHPDARIQRMAEGFVETWMENRKGSHTSCAAWPAAD